MTELFCDNCKREFEGDESLMNAAIAWCPDCEEDLNVPFIW